MTPPPRLRREPTPRFRALRHRIADLAGMGLACLLVACGGGGPAAEPVIEQPPGLSGVATDALAAQDALDVTVKGSAGLARTRLAGANGRCRSRRRFAGERIRARLLFALSARQRAKPA